MENNKHFILLIALIVLSVLNLGISGYLLRTNLSSAHTEQNVADANDLDKKLDKFFEI